MDRLLYLLDQDMVSKIVVGIFLLLFFSIPLIILIIYPPTRIWFKNIVEGHDGQLDPEDLHRLARMIAFMFSLVLLGFMIMSSGVMSVRYPVEAWIIVGGVVLGAEGIVIAQILRKK